MSTFWLNNNNKKKDNPVCIRKSSENHLKILNLVQYKFVFYFNAVFFWQIFLTQSYYCRALAMFEVCTKFSLPYYLYFHRQYLHIPQELWSDLRFFILSLSFSVSLLMLEVKLSLGFAMLCWLPSLLSL